MTAKKKRVKTYHFLVAHDGDIIKDSITVRPSELVSLGIKPIHCNPALRIYGITYWEIDEKELLGRKEVRGKQILELIDRVCENGWKVDYVASWIRDAELIPGKKRTDVYKHRIADLTGHGDDPCY